MSDSVKDCDDGRLTCVEQAIGHRFCDRSLLVHDDVRYEVEISVKAAYDPMELDLDRLQRADLSAELARLLTAIEGRTADELEAEVYKRFQFDLCLRCQREYLQDPRPRRVEG